MTTFLNLLQTAVSDNNIVVDLRSEKAALFFDAARALSKFSPIGLGATDTNPIQVLDFFCGAGGTSLGFAAINEVAPVFHFLAG